MDLATLIGFLVCTILVMGSMMMGGSLAMYWDLPSLLIVLGGAGFATMMRWPLDKFLGAFKAGLKAVLNDVQKPHDIIENIVQMAEIARKESILALEKAVPNNKFLAQVTKYMVDGYDVNSINKILDLEINALRQRHKDGRGVFEGMAESAPAFGMIGTVIGIVVIMANLNDPSKIGPGLAVALITTLYGSAVANMFFIPISAKLKYRSEEEAQNIEIIREGVNGILAGQNPRAIRERLEAVIGRGGQSGAEFKNIYPTFSLHHFFCGDSNLLHQILHL